MKHTPLTLALLALSAGPALAQSDVTIYGNFDIGLLHLSSPSGGIGYLPSTQRGAATTQLKDGGLGGSNWGLRGREDLGNGLKASFQIQGNLKLTSGEGGGPNSGSSLSLFNQMATVGLSGGFGEVKLGRQVSPMYYAMASTDARQARYFGSVLTGLVGMNSASGLFIGNNSNASFGTVYNDNAVVYTSPAWNHVTFNVEYAFGNSADSLRANSQQALTAVYDADGLKLSALYYNGYGNNAPAATLIYSQKLGSAAAGAAAAQAAGFTNTANTNRLASVGALYSWGPYTVSGSYFSARNPSKVTVPGGATELSMWSVGGGWKLAPQFNLTTGYYKISDDSHPGQEASQWALGLDYLMSKRTLLYAQAAAITNRGSNMNLSPIYGTAVVANKNLSAFMLGMRHSF